VICSPGESPRLHILVRFRLLLAAWMVGSLSTRQQRQQMRCPLSCRPQALCPLPGASCRRPPHPLVSLFGSCQAAVTVQRLVSCAQLGRLHPPRLIAWSMQPCRASSCRPPPAAPPPPSKRCMLSRAAPSRSKRTRARPMPLKRTAAPRATGGVAWCPRPRPPGLLLLGRRTGHWSSRHPPRSPPRPPGPVP
jgi:hypothetical protein